MTYCTVLRSDDKRTWTICTAAEVIPGISSYHKAEQIAIERGLKILDDERLQRYEDALEQISTGQSPGGTSHDNWLICQQIADEALTDVKGSRPNEEGQ